MRKHEVKSMYVLRDCCGAVKACSKKPIPYEVTECQTCGDNELKLYKVTYVRADVDQPHSADSIDLPFLGIEWDVIKQIDASQVDVWVIPIGYNFYEDDGDPIYGDRV
jgi:hypothetical protein